MGGIGGPEALVILLVALLVFGPKSIPGVARGVGKGMRELRRLATEFQREINLADAMEGEERRPIRERGRPPGPPAPGPAGGERPAGGEPDRPGGDEPARDRGSPAPPASE